MKKRRKEEEATTEGRELGPPSADAGKERRAGGRDRGKRENLPQGGNVRIGALTALLCRRSRRRHRRPFMSFFLFGSVSARVSESADLAFVDLSGVPYLY